MVEEALHLNPDIVRVQSERSGKTQVEETATAVLHPWYVENHEFESSFRFDCKATLLYTGLYTGLKAESPKLAKLFSTVRRQRYDYNNGCLASGQNISAITGQAPGGSKDPGHFYIQRHEAHAIVTPFVFSEGTLHESTMLVGWYLSGDLIKIEKHHCLQQSTLHLCLHVWKNARSRPDLSAAITEPRKSLLFTVLSAFSL